MGVGNTISMFDSSRTHTSFVTNRQQACAIGRKERVLSKIPGNFQRETDSQNRPAEHVCIQSRIGCRDTSRWFGVSVNIVTTSPVVVVFNFTANGHEQIIYVGQKHKHINESTVELRNLVIPLILSIYDHKLYLKAYTYQ